MKRTSLIVVLAAPFALAAVPAAADDMSKSGTMSGTSATGTAQTAPSSSGQAMGSDASSTQRARQLEKAEQKAEKAEAKAEQAQEKIDQAQQKLEQRADRAQEKREERAEKRQDRMDATAAKSQDKSEKAEQKAEARDTLQEAQKVVQKMQSDPGMQPHLQKAKGIFLVPNFGRGGAGVVAKGGEGVVMVRQPDGKWSNPAFYNMGGLSVGLQAGGSAGQVAFLLMTDKAIKAFDSTNNFSLNAGADLSIGNYSASGQASAGMGDDVIAWTDTEGLFAGVNIGVTDIVVDNEENRAFYGPQADARSILKGSVSSAPPEASSLKQALAGNAGGTTSAAGTEAATGSSPSKAASGTTSGSATTPSSTDTKRY